MSVARLPEAGLLGLCACACASVGLPLVPEVIEQSSPLVKE